MARTANVGRVSVSLEANTAEYVRQLARAQKRTEDEMNKMQKHAKGAAKKMDMSFNRIAGGVGIAIGALGAAGVAALKMAADHAKAQKEVQAMANVIGVSTSRMLAYGFAARSVGFDTEKFADQMKDLDDKIGDFVATGAGPMKDIMNNIGDSIGYTAEELQHMSGPDALQAIYKGMVKANVPAKQMTFYLESLASDLSRMTPLLADNGAEMEKLTAKYDEFNSVMSERTMKVFDSLSEQSSSLLDNMLNLFAESAVGVAEWTTGALESLNKLTATAAKTEGAINDLNRQQAMISGGDLVDQTVEQLKEMQTLISQNVPILEAEVAAAEAALKAEQDRYKLSAGRDGKGRLNTAERELQLAKDNLQAQKEIQQQVLANIKVQQDALSVMGGQSETPTQTTNPITDQSGSVDVNSIFGLTEEEIQRALVDDQILMEEYHRQRNALEAQIHDELNQEIDSLFGMNSADFQTALINDQLLNEQRLAEHQRFLKAKADMEKAASKAGIDLNATTLDMIAGMNIQLNEDSSNLQKGLFLAQQAAAITNSIMNTELAATKAMTVDPTGALAQATRIQGYASTAIIAAQTLGQFHDGTGYVEGTGSYYLQDGERVVNTKDNSDLTKFLAAGSSGDLFGGFNNMLSTVNNASLKDASDSAFGTTSSSSVVNITQNVNGSPMQDRRAFERMLAESSSTIAAAVQKEKNKRPSRVR